MFVLKHESLLLPGKEAFPNSPSGLQAPLKGGTGGAGAPLFCSSSKIEAKGVLAEEAFLKFWRAHSFFYKGKK